MIHLFRQKGISLIEILITLVVLSIGILGFMSFQGKLITYNDDAHERTQALILASEKIEVLRAYMDYNNITTSSSQTIPNTPFSINWTVLNSAVPNPEYKQVTVNVNWQGRDAKNHTLTLTSIIGKFDLVQEGSFIITPTGFLSPI